jgi:hypothetical protein
MGPNAQASGMTFHQIWNQAQSSIDLERLARDLGQLRTALRSEAREPEQNVAIGLVAAAEAAARKGDGPKAPEHLKGRYVGTRYCREDRGGGRILRDIKSAIGQA